MNGFVVAVSSRDAKFAATVDVYGSNDIAKPTARAFIAIVKPLIYLFCLFC